MKEEISKKNKIFINAITATAGFPSPAENYIEEYWDIGKYLVNNIESTFFVRISGDSMINVGIYNNVLYNYTYWTQMYEKNMCHKPHNHAKLDPNFVDIISWVHFIDVPEQKCFRFLDNDGNFFVPDEQTNGDIICFPSWAWHEVIPNETEHRRLVISGNISVTHFDN